MTTELRRLIDLEVEAEFIEAVLPLEQEIERDKLEKMFESEHELVGKLKTLRQEFHQMKHLDADFIHLVIQLIDKQTKVTESSLKK